MLRQREWKFRFLSISRPKGRQVLDCASPLALFDRVCGRKSGSGLPQSKTLSRRRTYLHGSWSRCVRRSERRLTMNRHVLARAFGADSRDGHPTTVQHQGWRINCAPVRHCAGLPHDGQNFSPLNFAPQWVQKADLTAWTGSPQLPQNLAPDAMSDPHLAHLMTWAGVVRSMP